MAENIFIFNCIEAAVQKPDDAFCIGVRKEY